jgi:hypothetical protein
MEKPCTHKSKTPELWADRKVLLEKQNTPLKNGKRKRHGKSGKMWRRATEKASKRVGEKQIKKGKRLEGRGERKENM